MLTERSHMRTQYGVAPKTIRDVWNRRAWTHVTRPYWSDAGDNRVIPTNQLHTTELSP